MRSPTLIVAEAGVNHNGNLTLAKQLIDAAAQAGADLVKFQTFSAHRLVTQDAPRANYQIVNTQNNQSQFDMLSHLELSAEVHEELRAHCKERHIGFFSTAFDLESLEYLAKLGLPIFKVPSGEITNLPYLRRIGSFGKPIILSTGMSTLGEIECALDVLERAGTNRTKITVLHCSTEYPTPMGDVNLKAMSTIRDAFGVPVGYSDHTLGIEIPIAAVALGASVIEKHITIDRNLLGPDHKASIEPKDFSAMVYAIRNVERAMGDGIKRPTASEEKNKSVVRKSLIATKTIRHGEIFSSENIAAKRPGSGISPMRWDEIMGRAAPRTFLKGELIDI